MNNARAPQWFAFVTRPRHEKKVRDYLDLAGIENYLPLQKRLRRWKDRKKWIDFPLFSCYIFVFIDYFKRYDVLKVPSVVRIVGFNNEPTPVRAEEIDAIKGVIESNPTLEVLDGLVPGDAVRISSGPLSGQVGQLIEFRQQKWFVIHVTAIGKSVLVNIEENKVERI
jgi:transcription antitermination factor NusG